MLGKTVAALYTGGYSAHCMMHQGFGRQVCHSSKQGHCQLTGYLLANSACDRAVADWHLTMSCLLDESFNFIPTETAGSDSAVKWCELSKSWTGIPAQPATTLWCRDVVITTDEFQAHGKVARSCYVDANALLQKQCNHSSLRTHTLQTDCSLASRCVQVQEGISSL